ncbi:MAG: DUF3750 domain-containing protein [Burkholderiales bacterium]|nr:MAG: DUF3750 domain-containing protein [Burkholderiales bacterium]
MIRQLLKWTIGALSLLALLLLGPLAVIAVGEVDLDGHWSTASRESTHQAPDPRVEHQAVIHVYGARAFKWRGAFGIHTWIATKRRGADQYTVHQVLGWRAYRGGRAVSSFPTASPDFRWFNAFPELLAERRGPGVDALIDRIEAAVARYPYSRQYRVWPGPNSNTFTAYIAREVPELVLDLPPNALGKDFLPSGSLLARAPSGTGYQLSVLGLLGLTLAWEEGIELNFLGLSAGLDLNDLGLRLPGIGRLPLLDRAPRPQPTRPAVIPAAWPAATAR